MTKEILLLSEKRGKIVQNKSKRSKIWNWIEITLIVVFCASAIVLDFVKITYVQDELRNAMISKIVQQGCGSVAGILLLHKLRIRLFGGPKNPLNWLFLIPCLIVAIDNFQFSAFFNRESLQGVMYFERNNVLDVFLFACYCLFVGLFEECIFRGVLFSVMVSWFPKNKKGFLLTYVLSSIVFGLAHLMNGISIQVLYTVLTGGLFAFCLIKTKNIFACAFVHGVYNFCGMLLEKFNPETGIIGLGSGVTFDIGTMVSMAIVGVSVGLFVVYKTIVYPENERELLYQKLGVKKKEKTE